MRGGRRVFVQEEWEGSPVAGRPASRQMADRTSRQKWTADFLHSEEGGQGGRGVMGESQWTVAHSSTFTDAVKSVVTSDSFIRWR